MFLEWVKTITLKCHLKNLNMLLKKKRWLSMFLTTQKFLLILIDRENSDKVNSDEENSDEEK